MHMTTKNAMSKRLTKAVKAHCIDRHRMWRAYSGLIDTAMQPCYIVPKAEYERLTKAAKRGRRGK